MYYLRNLGRRKVRTALTILGITIGIWALVVFGSMANKINALVAGGSTYYADKITLSDGSGALGGFSSAPMSLKTADLVRNVDGVDVVVPAVMMLMDDQASAVTMGVPPMITGSVAGRRPGPRDVRHRLRRGSALTDRRRGHERHGPGLRHRPQVRQARRATRSMLKGVPFTVVGVLEPTLTAPDQAASVPIAAAQRLLVTSLPPMVQYKVIRRRTSRPRWWSTRPGADTEALATRIKAQVPGVATMTGKDFDKQIGSGDVDPQLDPRRDRPHQPRSSAACRSSTRWRCRSPSGPARSASSARSAAVARGSSASSSPRPA